MSYEIENQNRYRYKVNYTNKYFMVAAMLIACGDKEGDSGEESEEVEEATEEE